MIHTTSIQPLVVGVFFLLATTAFAQESPYSLSVGENAPDFVGVDQHGESMSLSAELEKGPVVLIFYRGAWCASCNKQLSELEDSLSFITQKGGTVLAVTPEKPNWIDRTISNTKASFKIIHDKDLNIMNAYHVTFRVQDVVLQKYRSVGINLFEVNGDNGPNLPVPATYIIGQDGKIMFSFFDPDHSTRATVGQILQNL